MRVVVVAFTACSTSTSVPTPHDLTAFTGEMSAPDDLAAMVGATNHIDRIAPPGCK